MRIGLLTEGGYPYVNGEARLWCDRLVRGLGQHEFDLYALSRSRQQEEAGWIELPPQVRRVRTAPLWSAPAEGPGHGRRARRRFADHYGDLADALRITPAVPPGAEGGDDPQADRFSGALYGLAELAREEGGLVAALRSETAVRALERACRAPGAIRTKGVLTVADLLTVAARVECALRPLSLDWYGPDGLDGVDLCHAASGGAAALPGLLARHFSGVPLLVTEYGVRLRAHYLAAAETAAGAPARALLAAFHRSLAVETYRSADALTPGNAHARRWQERCGAHPAKLRTVHPGMAHSRFTAVEPGGGDPYTLVWVGRIEPGKDLVSLLHAFARVHQERPRTRLRIVGAPAQGAEATAYLARCRALAARLFEEGPWDGPRDAPPGARGGAAHGVPGAAPYGALGREAAVRGSGSVPSDADADAGAGASVPVRAAGGEAAGQGVSVREVGPVAFEEIGGPRAPDLADAYAAAGVVVLSSTVEGFPISLVEAMFCGRATVSTDVGAVAEIIGSAGLVVPARDPGALAEACLALLRDSVRRARLGVSARARARDLFTVEQNVEAFRGLYLRLVPQTPPRAAPARSGAEVPFSVPAEMRIGWAAAPGAREARAPAGSVPVGSAPAGLAPAGGAPAESAPVGPDAPAGPEPEADTGAPGRPAPSWARATTAALAGEGGR